MSTLRYSSEMGCTKARIPWVYNCFLFFLQHNTFCREACGEYFTYCVYTCARVGRGVIPPLLIHLKEIDLYVYVNHTLLEAEPSVNKISYLKPDKPGKNVPRKLILSR